MSTCRELLSSNSKILLEIFANVQPPSIYQHMQTPNVYSHQAKDQSNRKTLEFRRYSLCILDLS